MEEEVIGNDTDMNMNIIYENNVLTLCSIPESIDIDKIKEKLSNYMESRIEYYRCKNRPPFIEDEFGEYFTAMSSDGCEIGGGNCGMDVITKNNEGIDVTCIVMKQDISNEKSLIQNFTSSGTNLDTLFIEKKDEEALSLFMNEYKQKIEKVKKDKNLTDLYILAYISTNVDIYLACLQIDISKIEFVNSGGFVKGKKGNSVNIILNNFINDNIGKVTLYKSKKRLELRLKKDILQKEFIHKIYSII
jgi:hypothetical protein